MTEGETGVGSVERRDVRDETGTRKERQELTRSVQVCVEVPSKRVEIQKRVYGRRVSPDLTNRTKFMIVGRMKGRI